MDVRRIAEDLGEALKSCSEYQRLTKARETVKQHQAAQIMFRDFQSKQMALQKQQMEGVPVTEKQAEELRHLYEIMSVNPYLRELFEAEFVFGGLMMEIQDILSKSLGLDEDHDAEEEVAEQSIELPTKKLWTPGS